MFVCCLCKDLEGLKDFSHRLTNLCIICKALLCQTKYLLGLLGTISKLQNESMTVIFQTVKCVAALNVGWIVKGITVYCLCKEREICTEVFKVLALSPQEMKGLMHSDIVWRGLNGGCKNASEISVNCFQLHYFLLLKWKKKSPQISVNYVFCNSTIV